MQRLLAAIFILALIPVFVGATRSSTSADSQSERSTAFGARLHCQILPDAPKRNDDANPTKVIGTVRFRCDEPGATKMQITVKIQKQNGDRTWADVAHLDFTASGAATTRIEGENFRAREVAAPCSEGTFRTYIAGSIQAAGGTTAVDRPGPRAFDPCRPSMFSGN